MNNERPVGATPDDATIGNLIRTVAGVISDVLTLATLEGRLAILSLVVMLAAGIVAAILVASVWFLLLGTASAALVAQGWPWSGVLLSIAAANAALAIICGLVIRSLSYNLLFATTRRALRPHATDLPHAAKTDSAQG